MKLNQYQTIIMGISTVLCSLFGCKASADRFQSVSVNKFEQYIADTTNVIRLDVRTIDEYEEGHIAGAINIDVLQPGFDKACLARLPKDKTIALYCRSGKRSKKAAGILSKLKYKVVELNTGYMGWIQEGKSVEK